MSIRQKIKKLIHQIKQKIAAPRNTTPGQAKNKKASSRPQIIPPHARNIPAHISTHYAHDVYVTPNNDIAPKTRRGFAGTPAIQRKKSTDVRLTATRPVAPRVAKQKPQKQRKTFNTVVNYTAWDVFFDNIRKQTSTTAIQEWQNAVVAELAAADKIATQNAEELHQFVESRINKFNTDITFDFRAPDVKHNKYIEAAPNDPWDKIATYAHDLDNKESKTPSGLRPGPYVKIQTSFVRNLFCPAALYTYAQPLRPILP